MILVVSAGRVTLQAVRPAVSAVSPDSTDCSTAVLQGRACSPPPILLLTGENISQLRHVSGLSGQADTSQTRQDWTRSQLRGLSVSAGQSVMCAARQNNIIATDGGKIGHNTGRPCGRRKERLLNNSL